MTSITGLYKLESGTVGTPVGKSDYFPQKRIYKLLQYKKRENNVHTPKKLSSYVLAIFVILSLALQSAQPALADSPAPLQTDGTRISYNRETNMVSFIGTDPGKPILIHEALKENLSPTDRGLAFITPYAKQYGLSNAAQELSFQFSEQDAGHEYYRYQQTYQGIPVMAGEIIVNANDKGELFSLSGEVSPNLKINTKPQILADEAQSTALNAIAKWYQATPGEFATSTPVLWIYDARLLGAAPHPVSLVWQMEITARDGSRPINELVLVDAKSGGIILHFNQIDTAWMAQKSLLIAVDHTQNPNTVPSSTKTQEIIERITIKADASIIQSSTTRDGPAITWYVSPSGNDANTCSSSGSPCATIQRAIDLSANGDVIWVVEGNYPSPVNDAVIVNKNLSFLGGWNAEFSVQNGYSVIDGQDTHIALFVFENITTDFDRFIIANGMNNLTMGGGGLLNKGAIRFSNSIIRDNWAGLWGGGIFNNGTVELFN